MTKRVRIALAAAALAVLATGCILISGQFLVQVELGDFSVNSALPVTGMYVDLPSDGTYRDHKSEIKSLEDVALVGSVHNPGAVGLSVVVYLMDGNSGLKTVNEITQQGTRVWGPLSVAAGATEVIDWNRSSKLFGSGKDALLDQAKGDGQFTLYAVSDGSPFQFDFHDAVFIAVIGAAK